MTKVAYLKLLYSSVRGMWKNLTCIVVVVVVTEEEEECLYGTTETEVTCALTVWKGTMV